MDISTLRNKLKSISTHTAPAPVAAPAPIATRPAAVAPQPAPQTKPTPAATKQPEQLGLNDIFGMDDSELRAISPRNTFSQLKVFANAASVHTNEVPAQVLAPAKTVATFEVPAAQTERITRSHRLNVGLNDLLTMDAEKVDMLFSHAQ